MPWQATAGLPACQQPLAWARIACMPCSTPHEVPSTHRPSQISSMGVLTLVLGAVLLLWRWASALVSAA